LVFNSFSNKGRSNLRNNQIESAEDDNQGLFGSITKKLGRLIHATLILPLATPFLPALVKERKTLDDVDDRKVDKNQIVPKRPPRFFYRNKILVPFSE